MATPRYIGTKEAAELLSVSHDTVARLCNRGEIKGAWRAGAARALRMTREAVLDYQRRNTIKPEK